ncbi:hypothetical protein ABPG74_015622 [Tetrahymena malaccensis]
MSFNPTEMLQKIRLQNQIQNSSLYKISLNTQEVNLSQRNSVVMNQQNKDSNYIPANPNSIYYMNKQGQRSQNDKNQQQQRNSLKSQNSQHDSQVNKAKNKMQVSQEMNDNERSQVQKYMQKINENNQGTKLDSELIENLILKIQKLESQVTDLTSNLNEANTSVNDLRTKKMELENELSEQIALQLEKKQMQQQNSNNNQDKAATFGRVEESILFNQQMGNLFKFILQLIKGNQDKNVFNTSQKQRTSIDIAHKLGTSMYDEFQMHAISEQLSEEDDDQRSKLTFVKKQQIADESAKNFDEEIIQLRLRNQAKMESISDILKKKGKSPLKVNEQQDLAAREEPQKPIYSQKQNQSEDQLRNSLQTKNLNSKYQQSAKENIFQQQKRKDQEQSKSPLSQSQVLNQKQKSFRVSQSQNEENLQSSQKYLNQQKKEDRQNTSTTPSRQSEKYVGRLNLDLLSNLIKMNPCLNRPVLTIKMDDNLFN